MAIFDSKIATCKCQGIGVIPRPLKQCLICVDQQLSIERRKQAAKGEEAAERQPGRASGLAPRQKDQSVGGGRQYPEKQREDGRPEAEKRRNQRKQLHVAQSHALSMTELSVEPADQQKQQRRAEDREQPVAQDVLRPC